MKNITDFLYENLNEADEAKLKELEKKLDKVEDKADDAAKEADKAQDTADDAAKEADKAEESIKDEKAFRDYCHNKGEKVFGDKCDMDKIDGIADGLLKKYKDDVDAGEWGKLVGVFNKSFGH